MKLFQSYIKKYMMIFFGGLLLVGSFNFIVDPQKIFAVVDIKGFNHEKPFITTGGMRKLKSLEIERGNYDTILLGTSRTEVALYPLHPAFKSSLVYNAGLSGTNMFEIYKVFQFTKNNTKKSTVILGLDFLTFSNKRNVSGNFNDSRFANKNIFSIYIDGILSMKNTIQSLITLTKQERTDISYINGFRNRKITDINHRKVFHKVLKNYLTKQNTYAGFSYSKNRLDLFRKFVEDCRQKNIKLYLFISPIHARQIEAMRVLNIFPEFEQWKRDLVQIIAEDTVENPNKQPILLWDFSGYNSITTEAIPPAGSKQEMKWYWESSHYKKELGDMLLDIMFNYPQKPKNTPNDFGVIINSSNIELHLERIRAEQARYQQNFPQEVEEVEKLARETAHLRESSQKN